MSKKNYSKAFFLPFILQISVCASHRSFDFNEAELETMKDKVKVGYDTHNSLLKNEDIQRKMTKEDLNNFYTAFSGWFSKKLSKAIEKEILEEDQRIEGKKIKKKYTFWDPFFLKKMKISLRTSRWMDKKDIIDKNKEKQRTQIPVDMITLPNSEIRDRFCNEDIPCVMDFTFITEYPNLNCILRFLKNR
ncbi:MAG: hypothetical protein AAF335_03530, partial [Bacteroidota bacterium]